MLVVPGLAVSFVSRPGSRVTFDKARATVKYRGRVVRLTPGEVGIVHLLSRRPGAPQGKVQIMDAAHIDRDTLDYAAPSAIKRLRKKLASIGLAPIRTHYGFGYYWSEDVPCSFC